MCTVVIQFVLLVAMETVRFHIAEISFSWGHFFPHVVGPSEQVGTHDKLFRWVQGSLH